MTTRVCTRCRRTFGKTADEEHALLPLLPLLLLVLPAGATFPPHSGLDQRSSEEKGPHRREVALAAGSPCNRVHAWGLVLLPCTLGFCKDVGISGRKEKPAAPRCDKQLIKSMHTCTESSTCWPRELPHASMPRARPHNAAACYRCRLDGQAKWPHQLHATASARSRCSTGATFSSNHMLICSWYLDALTLMAR